jgi:hypothetical protein
MSDVTFTVDLDELAQLAKSLGNIYITFTRMPAHQPVDDNAIGNVRLAGEFSDFLNGWSTGRKTIETELQVIAKHVENALEEYTVAEHSVTFDESNLANGGLGPVALGVALMDAYSMVTRVVGGVEVTDPTFTATQGLASESVTATQSTNVTDGNVQTDVGMSDPSFAPTPGLAQEVIAADQDASHVDEVVREDLGMGASDPGQSGGGAPPTVQPVNGGPVLGGPGTTGPFAPSGPPQLMRLPLRPPQLRFQSPTNLQDPRMTADPILAGPPGGIHLPEGQTPLSGSTTL